MSAAIDTLIAELAEMVAERVVDKLRAGERPGWVDQSESALGPRRHCALARRLMAEGSGDASKVGRRLLIRRERLDAELGLLGQRPAKATAATALANRLHLVRGDGS